MVLLAHGFEPVPPQRIVILQFFAMFNEGKSVSFVESLFSFSKSAFEQVFLFLDKFRLKEVVLWWYPLGKASLRRCNESCVV